ncbi:MAG: hypothetical protein ACKOYC_08795 [Bacteroidota bacterium]
MNYIRLGLLCVSLFIAGNVSAQSNSSLNGKKYWYMMKNADGTGEEIHDNIQFADNTVVSERLASYNTQRKSKISERLQGDVTVVETTILGEDGSQYMYQCNVQGNYIDGTIVKTNSDGTTVEMRMRGMVRDEFDRITKEKEDYRKKQPAGK